MKKPEKKEPPKKKPEVKKSVKSTGPMLPPSASSAEPMEQAPAPPKGKGKKGSSFGFNP